jgi:predicted DNA-binding transcriptional regulator AlpA
VSVSPPRELEDAGAAPLYWTPQQFASVVQLSVASISRLISRDPSFPAVRIGGAVRIPRDRVLRWLRDREQGQARPRLVRRQEGGGA